MISFSRSSIRLGPVYVRLSRKNLAKWGYEAVKIGGLRIWSRSNNGNVILASYHPKSSTTWWWSLSIYRAPLMFSDRHYILVYLLDLAGNTYSPKPSRWRKLIDRPRRRQGQWNTRIRLPFGYVFDLSQQNYHRMKK